MPDESIHEPNAAAMAISADDPAKMPASPSASDMADFDKALDSAVAEVGELTTEPEPPKKESKPPVEPPKEDAAAKAAKAALASAKPPPEEKPASQAKDAKDSAPAAQPPAATVPHDKDVDSIEKPRNLNPANSENWERLRTVAKERGQKLSTIESQLAAAQKQIAEVGAKIPDEVTKELTELRGFRRMYDIENDPEFAAQFDGKVKQNAEGIIEILKDRKLPEETLKAFAAQGGVSAMPFSWWERTLVQKLGEDGKPVIGADGNPEMVEGKGWLRLLRESSDPKDNAAAILIEEKLKENIRLGHDRSTAIQNAAKDKSEYAKKIEESRANATKDFQTRVQKTVEETIKDIPWARLQEVPANATPEEKARIEKDNKEYEVHRQRLQMGLNPKSPEERAHVAMASVFAFRIMDEYQGFKGWADNRIKALEGEVNNLKRAGSAPRSVAAPKAPKTPLNDRLSMKNEDAIELGLSEVEG